jgi:hypothetical protein
VTRVAIVSCRVIAVTGHPSAAVLAGPVCLVTQTSSGRTLRRGVITAGMVGVVVVPAAMRTIVLVLFRAVPSHGVMVIEACIPAA